MAFINSTSRGFRLEKKKENGVQLGQKKIKREKSKHTKKRGKQLR